MATGKVTWDLLPGTGRAGLREICGYDQNSVHGTDTISAIELLDRLLVDAPGARVRPGSAIRLTTADRDRLLATVYTQTFGPRVEGTIHCRSCKAAFDLDFSLPELLGGLHDEPGVTGVQQEPDGLYALPDGRRFRLPTGEDECAVWDLAPADAESGLLQRCVIAGDPAAEPEVVQAAMREAAPLLDLELEARCPECAEVQPVHFDIQSYLLSALESEQEQLARQVHRLAIAYGWSLTEILSLTRSQRRRYVSLIDVEGSRQPRWNG